MTTARVLAMEASSCGVSRPAARGTRAGWYRPDYRDRSRVQARPPAAGPDALAATLGVIFADWGAARSRPSGSRAGGPGPARHAVGPAGLPAVESGLLPWKLRAPLSREVAVAGLRGRLLVLGGLTSG